MTSINLPLNDVLEQFIAQRAATGDYAGSKDCILALLEEARQRTEQCSALEAKLLEGVAALDRGEGQPMTAANWERLRANVQFATNGWR